MFQLQPIGSIFETPR